MKNIAVITGDLVNSTEFDSKTLSTVLGKLKDELNNIDHLVQTYAIYRGDSFQCVVQNPTKALEVALLLKSAVNSIALKKVDLKNTDPEVDVRLSIGIGSASLKPGNLEESNGVAFHNSGRKLDVMKSEGVKMSLTTNSDNVNDEFVVHLKFLDSITDRWSIASAEVVYYLIKNHKEVEIAKELERSQAAINYRKKAAGWEEIKMLLHRYEVVAKNYFV